MINNDAVHFTARNPQGSQTAPEEMSVRENFEEEIKQRERSGRGNVWKCVDFKRRKKTGKEGGGKKEQGKGILCG